jgi:hypothetical protein
MVSVLSVDTNLSKHVVQIGGPHRVLRAVRHATATDLYVAGLRGRVVTASTPATAVTYHVSVAATCQTALLCPDVDNARLTTCLSTKFPGMTVEDAVYRPSAPKNDWKWPVDIIHSFANIFSGEGIPFWSDLSPQQQLVWAVWAVVPMIIITCGSLAVYFCQRKQDRAFALVANEEMPQPLELSGQPDRAYGDGDRPAYWDRGGWRDEPFLVPERELTPGLQHFRYGGTAVDPYDGGQDDGAYGGGRDDPYGQGYRY